jgi:DNA-binding NtrC family response regulator
VRDVKRPLCTVLLVEEDAPVRNVLATSLSQQGLFLRLAATGAKAIELYRDHAESIGIVLLDVGMKSLDSPRTFLELQKIDPGVLCCFMTGGAVNYNNLDLIALGAARVFLKPFDVGEVTQVLTELAPRLTVEKSGALTWLLAHPG